MAECEKIMLLCEESLDRTLTPEEQRVLDRHLAGCPACAAYLADLRFLSGSLGELPDPPTGLHERIMSSIRTEANSGTVVQLHRPGARRTQVFTMLAAAAACVMLVLSGALGNLMNSLHLQVGGGGSSSAAAGGMEASAESGAADTASPADAASPAAPTDTADAGMSDGAAVPQTAAESNTPRAAKFSAPTEPITVPETSADNGTAPPAAEENSSTVPSPSADDSTAEIDAHIMSRSASPADSGQPQVAAFINEIMAGESFAACYLVEGGQSLPEIGQEQQRDSLYAYYVLDNNPAQLETLLDTLKKAGCTVSLYTEDGVLWNETAKQVIFAVRLTS